MPSGVSFHHVWRTFQIGPLPLPVVLARSERIQSSRGGSQHFSLTSRHNYFPPPPGMALLFASIQTGFIFLLGYNYSNSDYKPSPYSVGTYRGNSTFLPPSRDHVSEPVATSCVPRLHGGQYCVVPRYLSWARCLRLTPVTPHSLVTSNGTSPDPG